MSTPSGATAPAPSATRFEDLEAHRVALTGHCYRMLGSAVDADDAVQETMLRAWRHLSTFDGRASLRTWLYRIATNVCLDERTRRSRREHPVECGPCGTVEDRLETRPPESWIEPIADARAVPTDVDPGERVILRQTVRLAFVAALQHLPPRQRAVLLLIEVLGWSAAETAETLALSVAAVNSALQRARATMATRPLADEVRGGPSSNELETDLVNRYCAAFERYDVDALVGLLARDATLSMPPYTLWLRGPEAIRHWLLGPGAPCRGSRIQRVEASGLPGFAQWRDNGRTPWALVVLEPGPEGMRAVTSFLDVERLFPRFGVPLRLL